MAFLVIKSSIREVYVLFYQLPLQYRITSTRPLKPCSATEMERFCSFSSSPEQVPLQPIMSLNDPSQEETAPSSAQCYQKIPLTKRNKDVKNGTWCILSGLTALLTDWCPPSLTASKPSSGVGTGCVWHTLWKSCRWSFLPSSITCPTTPALPSMAHCLLLIAFISFYFNR